MARRQYGFTLVEIAIVLVIIGLLLGGILKGQELINSARVRNVADTNSGIQAAYFGFIDRYRQVPGDWAQPSAEIGIGQEINSGGNQNGTLDVMSVAGESGAVTSAWQEPAALWEHLWKAGFIAGSYDGLVGGAGGSVPDNTNYNQVAPKNPFNGALLLAYHADYDGQASPRLNLVLGRYTPVNIVRELDVKVDDGRPTTGILRLVKDSTTFTDVVKLGGTACKLTTSTPPEYDIATNQQDCAVTYLY
jgi:prepilin-type N-terminal cleavage/methylation domain-containing protein